MRGSTGFLFALWAAASGSSAAAEVAVSNDLGFVSHNEAVVTVPPEQAWRMLVTPGEWWSSAHTYSGSAANMTMDVSAGGCFCETVPAREQPSQGQVGQVEHMRVVMSLPYSTLRLSGGLGPLQSEPVSGVLTVTLRPEESGTRIIWDYVVGGYMRTKAGDMAPLVDAVIEEQLQRLASRLGKVR